ncbi:spinster family MFS transporter [Kordiimonas pumila]|uniref:Spinster family MFS transporter n=1 Tax=Kordiimonas pumila TaxID=2161677 RepID=A0ABV7D5Y5_9PROT|nr:MFS transporter [Kordiimonas pumila]
MSEEQKKSSPYAWYVVLLCMIAYIFSSIDRQLLAILIEPIKEDLQISDTQFSLLHGLAFSLFYATMGIPIARLADTRSRPLIISAGVFLWSMATVTTGIGRSFWQLFAARVGLGVGEAALSPAAYSMITDMFSKDKLGRALAVYSIGNFIGGGLSFLIGGAVIAAVGSMDVVAVPVFGNMQPWQVTFLIVGFPGMLLAILFGLTVTDPTRSAAGIKIEKASFGQTLKFIRANGKCFFAIYGGFTLCALALFGLMTWLPAFLGRNYGLKPGEIGLILGPIFLVANVGGVLASGLLTDYFEKKGYKDASMRAGMIGAIGLLLPAVLFCLMPSLTVTIIVIAIALFFASFPLATSATAMQLAAPPHMRAQVSAIFLFVNNLIGLAVGTTLIALITDYVFQNEASVGYSVAIVCGLAAFSAAIIIKSGLKPFAELSQRS